MTLFPHHIKDLERSGITEAQALAAGVTSHDSSSLARHVYGPRSAAAMQQDGYRIPFLDLDGNPVPDGLGGQLCRYRLFGGDPGAPKYLSRVGARYGLFIPPTLQDALRGTQEAQEGAEPAFNRSDYLIVTEGEKKVWRASNEGFPAVGLSGVYMWADPDRARVAGDRMTCETPLLRDLYRIAADRTVIVMADSDAKTNFQVRHAMRTLAKALVVQTKAAGVRYVEIPTGLDGTDRKLGLDDLLLLTDGADLLEQLIKDAEVIRPGLRARIPYGEGPNGLRLQYFIPYQAGRDPWLPAISKQVVKVDGQTKEPYVETVSVDVPYVWHKHTLRVVDAPDGVAMLDDPDCPVTIVDEFEGVTTDRRKVTLRVPAEELAKPERWNALGFYATPKGLPELQRMVRASRESGVSGVKLATYKRGWILVPGHSAPHYVYGETVIAPAHGKELISLTRSSASQAANSGIKQAGEYDKWLEVYRAVLHNPAVAVLSGFAVSAPLLGLVDGTEPGIINLVGASGSGKTTLLSTIASLVGSPARPSSPGAYIGTWRMTDNGAESPLAARSDCVALLDEVHQAPVHTDWMAMLYMAANGRGKARMTKEIEERAAKAWRVQLLSSGEESLASKVRASRDGKGQMPGGLQFRVIDLDCGTAGLWSDVADKPDRYGFLGKSSVLSGGSADSRGTGALVEAIEAELGRHHGFFWPRLIAWLQEPANVDKARQVYATFKAKVEALLAHGSTRIVQRRIKHVAASLTGLAILMAVTETEDRDVMDKAFVWATTHLWKAGLEYTTGDEGDLMADRVIERIMAEPGRLWRKGASTVKDTWGWVNEDGSVFITGGLGLPSLASDMGFDPSRVRAALMARGWSSSRTRPPQAGRSALKVAGIISPPGLFRAMDEEAV